MHAPSSLLLLSSPFPIPCPFLLRRLSFLLAVRTGHDHQGALLQGGFDARGHRGYRRTAERASPVDGSPAELRPVTPNTPNPSVCLTSLITSIAVSIPKNHFNTIGDHEAYFLPPNKRSLTASGMGKAARPVQRVRRRGAGDGAGQGDSRRCWRNNDALAVQNLRDTLHTPSESEESGDCHGGQSSAAKQR